MPSFDEGRPSFSEDQRSRVGAAFGPVGDVFDLNEIVQDVTVGLVLLAFFIAQWLLYAAIVLVVAKYAWRFAKYVWYT